MLYGAEKQKQKRQRLCVCDIEEAGVVRDVVHDACLLLLLSLLEGRRNIAFFCFLQLCAAHREGSTHPV